MENVAKMPHMGTLSVGSPDLNDTRGADGHDESATRSAETSAFNGDTRGIHEILTVDPDNADDADMPRGHVRSPELRRHGTKILMAVSAVIGAAAGVRLLFGANSSDVLANSISQMLEGTFGEAFLRQTLLGALFLAAELVLGFFAFGDLAVWAAPFLYSAGTVLRVAAGSPKLLPGSLICLFGVIMGAAFSAEMSGLLLKLTRGGTVYMDTHPRRSYALEFVGCLAAVILGSILTGALVG